MKKLTITTILFTMSSVLFAQEFDKDTTYYISGDQNSEQNVEEVVESLEDELEEKEAKLESTQGDSEESKKPSYEIKTLLSTKEKGANGGFGAIMFNYTSMNDQDALLGGVRGGWIINHAFSIGVGGYGLITGVEVDSLDTDGNNMFLGTGYGGLYMEIYVASKQPVHLTFPILVGAGGATYYNNYNTPKEPNEPGQKTSSAYFVVEPGIHLEANVTRAFRISAGANYRYTRGLDLENIASDALNGWSAGITFKFGKF